MKKKWILAGVAVGLVALAVVWVLLIHTVPHRINADHVERIGAPGGPHSREDIEKFVELFKDAEYKGKDNGYGTTPDWHVGVYFVDGNYLLIHQYGGYNFLVVRYFDGIKAGSYFIQSQQLFEYIQELRQR